LAVLKEVLMASMSSGFNLEREYQIRNTPKAIGSMVKMIFLELNFKNYVNELSLSFGKTIEGLNNLASSNSSIA